jgi:hypothetical protein
MLKSQFSPQRHDLGSSLGRSKHQPVMAFPQAFKRWQGGLPVISVMVKQRAIQIRIYNQANRKRVDHFLFDIQRV